MSIKQLASKLERKGLEKKVTLNILTKDKLISPGWVYWREKDSIRSRYYAVVSSPHKPEIYFKQKIGYYVWGIRLPSNPQSSPGLKEMVKENIKKIKREIKEAGLEIIQEYIPDFMRD